MFFKADEGPTKDKQNVPCVDGVLICSTRSRWRGRSQARAAGSVVARYGGDRSWGLVVLNIDCHFCSLHELEKGLLDTLPTDIPAIRCLSSGDLVKLVQDHDAILSRFRVVVRLDQEPLDTALNVLTNVAGLREGVAVAYSGWDVELLAQGPGVPLSISAAGAGWLGERGILKNIGLSDACGAYQQQITFVYSSTMRYGRIFWYIKLGSRGSRVCGSMALLNGLVVARELIWISFISMRRMMPWTAREVLTFDRMGVTIWLEAVSLAGVVLTL